MPIAHGCTVRASPIRAHPHTTHNPPTRTHTRTHLLPLGVELLAHGVEGVALPRELRQLDRRRRLALSAHVELRGALASELVALALDGRLLGAQLTTPRA